MRAISARSRLAIEAVARHFSATWREGPDSPDAFLSVAGKRIAVELAIMSGKRAPVAAKPRLRFDKVALGLVRRLRADLSGSVPNGKLAVATVTAPIRLAAKTATALADKIRKLVADGSTRARFNGTIHANRIQVRIIPDGSNRASKLIGFVHNPDSDADNLFDVTRSLLACIGPKLGTRTPPGFAGERYS